MKKILIIAMKSMELKKNSEVSLLLTNDKEIHDLNKIFRNINSPTDVLAFSMSEGSHDFSLPEGIAENLLGDIIISIETAKKQAKLLGHSLEQELTVLLIHGLLHLLEFDHISIADSEKMKVEEERILKIVNKELK
jgi:probable rRNA maturation factor